FWRMLSFFFSSRRRHTRFDCDWSSDVCSSDLRMHLECEGWCILDHRFRIGHTEIDLIARRETIVAFIEVKTRLTTHFGSPFEAEIGRACVGKERRSGGGW